MRYHAEFGHSTSKSVGITGDTPKFGSAGAVPLGGGMPDPYKHAPPTWVTTPNLIADGQTVRGC